MPRRALGRGLTLTSASTSLVSRGNEAGLTAAARKRRSRVRAPPVEGWWRPERGLTSRRRGRQREREGLRVRARTEGVVGLDRLLEADRDHLVARGRGPVEQGQRAGAERREG